jgi:hypothetical protein
MVSILASNPDLFAPARAATVEPWKPVALPHVKWPPDYRGVLAWRMTTYARLKADPDMLAKAKQYYAHCPGEFIMHWMDTYDPRKSPTNVRPELRGPKWMPFVFFERQDDFINFLHAMRLTGENGLVEKARDMGATWQSCAYSVWSWLFIPADAIGWGSRKQELVDKIGDVSSIFEKLRLLIRRLPDIWLPEGLKPRDHLTFMKCINPATGATITGETGDNIGRGGRTSMYFKDESAHYERPEKIEAALGDNTHVQIDISSVNGPGNVFHRKRLAGQVWTANASLEPGFTRVFIIDWRDHPEKTQVWYDQRKAKADREGMVHVFAQEVDRNYTAALENNVISYEWIEAAVDAHLKLDCLRVPPPNVWMAGLDVADGGRDRNALALRQWVILRHVEQWSVRDPGITMRRAIGTIRDTFKQSAMEIQADLIGVGSGVKTEYNRLVEDKIIDPSKYKLVFWNAGGAVVDPYDHIISNDDESPLNGDFFYNFKAQAWWSLRTRFYKTFKAITEGAQYRADELISLDGTIAELATLMQELSQPTTAQSKSLQTLIDKRPDGVDSPNMADSVVQAFFPVPDTGRVVIGTIHG